MKTNIILKTIFIAIVIVGAVACVPQKKFEMVQAELEDCNSRFKSLSEERDRLVKENKDLEDKISGLDAELKTLQGTYNATRSECDNLQLKFDNLVKTTDALKSGSEKEIQKILTELNNTQDSLQKREDRLAIIEKQVFEKEVNLQALQEELEAQQQKLNELQKILDEKNAAVENLRKSVADALLGFEGKGLSIDVRNGKVYVSLDENLLFATGKWTVASAGKDALRKLSAVLAENPDINVLVEGHTDNVPLHGAGQVKDNWDLSVLRATAIVKILLENKSIDPKRLTAAGRSEYLPIDPANSVEARKKNRRTEIILTPKLDELFKILESN